MVLEISASLTECIKRAEGTVLDDFEFDPGVSYFPLGFLGVSFCFASASICRVSMRSMNSGQLMNLVLSPGSANLPEYLLKTSLIVLRL